LAIVTLVQRPQERLIIFTRYPTPGRVKTRLIPALGELGAATVHRQMTEHTLLQARKLCRTREISISVYFDGNERQHMQDWLGSDLIYQAQADGDLGWRMARSISEAFQDGIDRVVIIGTDCPGLNAELMSEAFHQLLTHDLVLGPAIDGGYYAIGLRYFIPELFVGIIWGTDRVLSQTVEIANKLNLSVAYLPALADVDRPEDLPVWDRIQRATSQMYASRTIASDIPNLPQPQSD
jgi:uncharacterized protein